MNLTPSLLLPQNNNGSYILLQNFPLKMPEIFININFTSWPPRWEAPSPPEKLREQECAIHLTRHKVLQQSWEQAQTPASHFVH